MIRQQRIAAVAALGVFAALAGCHRDSQAKGPQYIMLMYNGGDCQQNGSDGIVDIYANQALIYQGATMQNEFQVRFTSCPLADGFCPVNSPNGNSVNVGTPLGSAAGSTFMYNGMTINHQLCKNADSMGVRVRAGRQ